MRVKPSAEADGFTGPLEVGQCRLTPTGDRAEVPCQVDGHGPTIRKRLQRKLPPFRDRAPAHLNGLLMQAARHDFMLKLSPQREGFHRPKVRQ